MNKACIKFNKVIFPQKHVYVYKYLLHLQKDKKALIRLRICFSRTTEDRFSRDEAQFVASCWKGCVWESNMHFFFILFVVDANISVSVLLYLHFCICKTWNTGEITGMYMNVYASTAHP